MNYLVFDTSSKALSVLCKKDDTFTLVHQDDCALKHSILLMDTIDETLAKANAKISDLDYVGCVIGPGSFTGIRIGIATAKGFCLGAEKKPVAITAFELIAYTLSDENVLALVDAGRGYFYACGYDKERNITFEAKYCSSEEVEGLRDRYTLASLESLSIPTIVVKGENGLAAAMEQAIAQGKNELEALYLRKSQAEEQRK